MRKIIAIVGLVVVVAGIVIVRHVGTDDSSDAKAGPIGEEYSAALRALAPNTTLHTLFKEYRRHGELDESMRDRPDYRPETVYVESWIDFDDAGNASSMRTETRGEDGSIYERGSSDGSDVVISDPSGRELTRTKDELRSLSVGRFKDDVSGYYATTVPSLDRQKEELLRQSLRGVDVFVTEALQPAKSSSFRPGPNVEGYEIPYSGDLDVDHLIERQFISASELSAIRTETAAVDSTGNETVLESTDQLVVEVLPK